MLKECFMENLKINKNKYKKIEYDSRLIEKGDIFVALTGKEFNGHDYIEKAIENGAKCVLHSQEIEKKEGIEYFLVKGLRKKLGEIASEFYDWPQKKLKIIGITGTNGKTTTTYLLEELLNEPISRIGTIEYKIGDEIIEAPNTTPESLDIVKMCAKSVKKGVRYLIMEVSSHALVLGRVDMLEFDVVIFSNLTPEHLDFHSSMEKYFLAKRELFMKKKKKEGNFIINIDDIYGVKYFQEFKGISYGIGSGLLKAEYVDENQNLVEFTYTSTEDKNEEKKSQVKIALLGRYNLYNILSSIGAVLTLGYKWEEIMIKIPFLKGAPGRFEKIDCGQNFTAIVDYAHTEDALENLLKTVKGMGYKKIITVFGCGGDRDRVKRAEMAKVSEKYSDVIILTSDNPRKESIESIIKDSLEGFSKNLLLLNNKNIIKKLIVEIDREEAIIKAVQLSEKDSIIVVAGKGHETYQIINKEKYHFDDREYLRREILRKTKN
ncbi:MAG: UDP-N-acetylmuramoyl-L-alanyl-D-glutamate--2,6-diaminopimelate ligase [Fusobacteriaceae bacterium]